MCPLDDVVTNRSRLLRGNNVTEPIHAIRCAYAIHHYCIPGGLIVQLREAQIGQHPSTTTDDRER